MRCARCGHEYPEGALFCSECGEVAPNLSEEDAKMAAVLSQSQSKPPAGPGANATGTATGIKGPAEFGTASMVFALGIALFAVSFLMSVIYGEVVIFGDHPNENSAIADIAQRVMNYTGDLGWIALAGGVLLILRGIAEKRSRMEGILWPDHASMNTAATVALVALVLEAIILVADVALLEFSSSASMWEFSLRVTFYLSGAAMATVALTFYVAADSLARANRTM